MILQEAKVTNLMTNTRGQGASLGMNNAGTLQEARWKGLYWRGQHFTRGQVVRLLMQILCPHKKPGGQACIADARALQEARWPDLY